MKNFILVMTVCLFSSSAFANDCCTVRPIRAAASSVTNVARNVVSAPFRLTRKVVKNSRARRAARQCARNCCDCN